MKKLVVMVSVYEAGDWLENRLQNLLQSSIMEDMEIWVINANSPDPRDDEIPKKFPVRYVKLSERIGVYAAWNHIISNSESFFITNANSDDLIAPEGYEQLLSCFDSFNIGFAYPSWYTTSTINLDWDQVLHSGLASADGTPGHYHGDLGNGGVGHFPVWRRSLHKQFGLFNESFKALGDAEFWARCYYIGGSEFRWLNNFLACYLWRDGQNLWHREINQDEWDNYHTKVNNYRCGQN